MIKPYYFDGGKFANKYNLDPFKDFYDDGRGNIVCPSRPDLTDDDLLDCIAANFAGRLITSPLWVRTWL